MIFIPYLLLAVAIVWFSNKASVYVDLLDKKTNLSGAFIGGVMLSAVTSLPELFTSISSTLMLDKPDLCMGNILGSNLFNLTILAVSVIVSFKAFQKAKIANSHVMVSLFVTGVYIVLLLNMFGVFTASVFGINLTSIVILILYALSLKYLSNEDGTAEPESEDTSPLSVKVISTRFVGVSLCIIGLSIAITYVTDLISVQFNMGAGLAGALFLGIATSLPEMASTIALFKMGNYNIAIGNIVGSNMFNFMILSITDLLYSGNGLYAFSDYKTVLLLALGAIAMPLLVLMMKNTKKAIRIGCSVAIASCYVLFLVL